MPPLSNTAVTNNTTLHTIAPHDLSRSFGFCHASGNCMCNCSVPIRAHGFTLTATCQLPTACDAYACDAAQLDVS